MPLGMEVGLGSGDCVTWGPSSPSPKTGRSPRPQFWTHVHCGQMAGWIKMALGIEVGLGPGHIVLDGDPAPLPKMGAEPPPQFSVHFYCDQTAGCIKMPLGMEVGLSPDDFVLDGGPAPLPKGGGPPIFSPCLLWPNGCMHQDITWYGGRPQPRRNCARGCPAPPPLNGQSPNLRPMSVVANRQDG